MILLELTLLFLLSKSLSPFLLMCMNCRDGFHINYITISSVRRILKRGGPENLRRTTKLLIKIVLLKSSPIFRLKSGEEQKKKDLHSNLVRFFAQN